MKPLYCKRERDRDREKGRVREVERQIQEHRHWVSEEEDLYRHNACQPSCPGYKTNSKIIWQQKEIRQVTECSLCKNVTLWISSLMKCPQKQSGQPDLQKFSLNLAWNNPPDSSQNVQISEENWTWHYLVPGNTALVLKPDLFMP